MDLSMPFEVLDSEDPELSACLQFYLPMPGPYASHAANVMTPTADKRCQQQEAGLVEIHMPARSHGMVSLTGVGAHPFHIQVTTGAAAHAMQPVRLLSDAALAQAYQQVDGAFQVHPHTAVIETPADSAHVTLHLSGGGNGPHAVYFDAEGNGTNGTESLAGGWAVFVNVPEGAHEVTMTHDELVCSADELATWGTSREDAVALFAFRDPDQMPIVPNSVAHSNAFHCR